MLLLIIIERPRPYNRNKTGHMFINIVSCFYLKLLAASYKQFIIGGFFYRDRKMTAAIWR